MDKELLDAIEDFLVKLEKVIHSMAEGHYLAGTSSAEYQRLGKAEGRLLKAIADAKARLAVPAPQPAPAQTT